MTEPTTPLKPERPTLAKQLAAQHEVLMALASKTASRGAQTISLAERTTGANNGDLYVKVDLVQQDDEDDASFIARMEVFAIACLEVRDRLNDAQAQKRAGGPAGGDGA